MLLPGETNLTLTICKGNVSYIMPTLHTMFAIPETDNSFPHHPTFAAAAGTDGAHEEALVVGKSLGMIGWEMITNDALFEQARSQWQKSVKE